MKFVFKILVVLTVLGFSGTNLAAQEQSAGFLATINDVPLMPGLEELVEESLVFDKPGGRIAETSAYGQLPAGQEIERYYNRVLPQLGWQRIAVNRYIRQGEELNIEISSQDRFDVVHFSVKPQ